MILLGLNEPQVKPEGTVETRATVPAKPFTALTVIVDVAEEPGATVDGEVALVVKSWNLKVAIAVCVRLPLFPVKVIVYELATLELQETVALPEPITLPGVMAPQDKPEGTLSDSVTVSVNPFNPVTVIVEVADCPARTPEGEVAEIEKSGPKDVVRKNSDMTVAPQSFPLTRQFKFQFFSTVAIQLR